MCMVILYYYNNVLTKYQFTDNFMYIYLYTFFIITDDFLYMLSCRLKIKIIIIRIILNTKQEIY